MDAAVGTVDLERRGLYLLHSLRQPFTFVREDTLPDCFEASAHGGGVLMAIRHRELPAEGVQFHPESVLTDAGKQLLSNFLA